MIVALLGVTAPAGAQQRPVMLEILDLLKSRGQISAREHAALSERAQDEIDALRRGAPASAAVPVMPPASTRAVALAPAPAGPAGTSARSPAAASGATATSATIPAAAPSTTSVTETAMAAPKDPKDFRVYWKEGVRFETLDKTVKARIGGRIQNDWGMVDPSAAIERTTGDTTTLWGTRLRRARIVFEGGFDDSMGFKAEYDFATGVPAVNDVYLWAVVPGLQLVQFGHQKEPLSLQGLTSANWLTFQERALPVVLGPLRETGITSMQAYADRRLTWAIGGFRDVDQFGFGVSGKNAWDVTTRLTGLPLWEDGGRRLVHLGAGYSLQLREDNEPRLKALPETVFGSPLIDTGTFPAGNGNLGVIEAAWVEGPFSLQAEGAYLGLESEAARNPGFWGWYTEASWFLTGEHRPYDQQRAVFGRPIPKGNFGFGPNAGWGAWQVAARYSQVDLSDPALPLPDRAGDAPPGKLSDMTLGVNWYLTPNFRWTFNYVYANRTPAGSANVAEMRFQVDY